MQSALAQSSSKRVGTRLHRIAKAEEPLKGGRKHCSARWRDVFKIRRIIASQFQESPGHHNQ
jgi:hypothetical protein